MILANSQIMCYTKGGQNLLPLASQWRLGVKNSSFRIEYLCDIEDTFEYALTRQSGAQIGQITEK